MCLGNQMPGFTIRNGKKYLETQDEFIKRLKRSNMPLKSLRDIEPDTDLFMMDKCKCGAEPPNPRIIWDETKMEFCFFTRCPKCYYETKTHNNMMDLLKDWNGDRAASEKKKAEDKTWEFYAERYGE
jgi:hypothetical protein